MGSTSKSICKENHLEIPEEIIDQAKEAIYNLIPVKSKSNYERQFQEFNEWRKAKRVHGINEDIALAYFFGLGKIYKASSLWTKYSMLKVTLKVFKNVDISRYMKFTAFLKGQKRTYNSKKASILERSIIEKYLVEAPDDKYLLMKVVLLIGVSGACRYEE